MNEKRTASAADSEREHLTNQARQHASAIARIGFLVIFALLQIAALAGVFFFFRKYFAHFYALCELLSLLVVLHIVREDTNPIYKIPWIILNLTLPILGGLSYLMFGSLRFSRRERQRAQRIAASCRSALRSRPDAAQRVPEEFRPLSRYLENCADAPVYDGTDVRFFTLGEELLPVLLEELEGARRFIFLEYFIIAPGTMWDSILDVLRRKAAQGVDVRVIYDDIGCLGLLPSHYARLLERSGIACVAFNPFTNLFSARFNNRDHRKICVIDGNVGFTGGINLADEYINAYPKHGHWKDTAVQLTGRAVWSLTVMFLSLWDYERRESEDLSAFAPEIAPDARGLVQPYTDIPIDAEHVGESVYCSILNRARKYVYITTPYLIVDNELISALTIAAKSGVDVRIITPGIPDKKMVWRLTRSYYGVLLRAGVKLYEYTPGFIHAKEFVADDRCAVVGTINLDYRSLCHHYECAALLWDVPAVNNIREDYLATLKQCREITPAFCARECGRHPLLVSLLRIFSPLF